MYEDRTQAKQKSAYCPWEIWTCSHGESYRNSLQNCIRIWSVFFQLPVIFI